RHGIKEAPVFASIVDYDQWTVNDISGAPFFRFDFGNSAGTQLYVSSVTGKVAQVTTAAARFWNWFVAVPHWLYFAQLRRNGPLWTEIVVWTSLAGTVLTLIGLYIGVRQTLAARAQAQARWSPYTGFLLWHHLPALCFGLLTFSFVASG